MEPLVVALNFFLPGSGTLTTQYKRTGAIQLALYLAGWLVIGWTDSMAIGALMCMAAWIWAMTFAGNFRRPPKPKY